MTAELLVDRRATLAQLMDVAHALRAFEEIAVGFRVRPELDDSPRARARWGFLELASRAIAGRRIALVEPQSCGETIEIAGARYTDCIDDDGQEARVLRDAGALTIAQWLDTPSELDDWIAIEVTRPDLVPPFSSELVWPHDPAPRTHQLGRSWPLSLFGVLAAVLVALVVRRRPAPRWPASSPFFDLPLVRASGAESPYRNAGRPRERWRLTDVRRLARSWLATSLWLASSWALAHLAAWLDR
jgi:hypothetical protein